MSKNISDEEMAKIVGKNIQKYRKLAGYTQKKLAEEAKVDRTAITKAEKGIFLPTIGFLLSIARALDVDYLEFFSEDKQDEEGIFIVMTVTIDL